MSRPKISIEKFREKWLETQNIGESLLHAGGSPKTALRGYAGLNIKCKLIVDGKEVRPASEDEIKVLLEKLKTPEDISEYAREKIIRAIELGQSPKNLEGHLTLLGKFKEHNIFDTKKSNEIFVLAPEQSAFDDMDNEDMTRLLEDGNGSITLMATEKKGFLQTKDGVIVKLRIFGANAEFNAALPILSQNASDGPVAAPDAGVLESLFGAEMDE